MLPEAVLEQAGAQITNFQDSGQSVMEMSHRSKVFAEIFDETKANLRAALNVPKTHEILFLQGGATMQFAAVPMNLTAGDRRRADYAITGSFSNLAYKEAQKFAFCNKACSSEDSNFSYIPEQSQLKLDPGVAYFYYCANNTIYGSEWPYVPETAVPLVSDMSSNILTREVDFDRHAVVFAGAQKNMAPAGVTVVIVRKDLPKALDGTPVMLDYQTMIKSDSMHNTPPCWSIYILGLTLKWMIRNGGIEGMAQLKQQRSSLVYDFIDNSDLFSGTVRRSDRSGMNITFTTGDESLDRKFVSDAESAGLVNLAGHRSVGGMRASMYNAMPIEGAAALVAFMKRFELSVKGVN
jgi:phosphoserine aminotransferase